jgi:hypothetical protein
MTRRVRQWLTRKWSREAGPTLAESYRVTFTGLHGERVLQHLMDGVYCSVYEGKDPIEAAHHNGRRSVVQEILENLDLAEQPQKYRVESEKEPSYAR